MDGTAARVLDYSAIWVHADGSSEMLEHEIQKLQSQEAINTESETEPPTGLVLRLRVIKPDGRVLEPEPVAGQADAHDAAPRGGRLHRDRARDAASGRRRQRTRVPRPAWFFREADKGYWRSEFVVVAPTNRELEIETRGNVPPPADEGARHLRRAPVARRPEPARGARAGETSHHRVPAERARRLGRLARRRRSRGSSISRATRRRSIRAFARRSLEIVRGVPATATDERARLLYRWVARARPGGQGDQDGRRVVTGGSGLAAGGVPLPAAPARHRERARAREEPSRRCRRSAR